jgi:S-adenosylmethionine:tRNA ribosyltransferase-isomerase
MQHPSELRIADYTYTLPDEKIARYPLAERDASKLLIYKDSTISESRYRNIADHIPPGTLMVFNQTKVVNARLLFKKATGSTIEVFCLAPHQRYPDIQTAMLQKGKVEWECLVGGAGKWKDGMVLQIVHTDPDFTLSARILERNGGSFILGMEWGTDMTFAEVLHHTGKVPLPPYLNRDAEITDHARYQTVFAREEGSVAAPTAGLHFTDEVLNDLEAAGVSKTFVTLHVGAGTFRPVKSETMQEHDMHAEWIEVTADAIRELINVLDRQIIAVGTTSLRTLESLFWIGNKLANGAAIDLQHIAVEQWDPYEETATATPAAALSALLDHMKANSITRLVTRTRILIAPGYKFRIISGLVTNFHQPQSTLLLLVAAITGSNWKRIYDHALSNDYRFLSYGDGCLLWVQQ